MQNIFVFLFIFFIQSCAFNMGREIKYMKKEPVPFDTVIIEKNPKIVKKFEAKSCVHIYSVIPDKLKADLSKILKESCSEGQEIRNAQLADRIWYIPIIYGEECYVVRGECAEI